MQTRLESNSSLHIQNTALGSFDVIFNSSSRMQRSEESPYTRLPHYASQGLFSLDRDLGRKKRKKTQGKKCQPTLASSKYYFQETLIHSHCCLSASPFSFSVRWETRMGECARCLWLLLWDADYSFWKANNIWCSFACRHNHLRFTEVAFLYWSTMTLRRNREW